MIRPPSPWGHPLHSIWRMMIARCENPDNDGYRRYGARGIKVCEQWHDFWVFAEEIENTIGSRPEGKTATGHPLYSLDRINSDGDYEPGNVRWADWKQQAANRRRPANWRPR